MRLVIQKVKYASLKVDGELISETGKGYIVFAGVCIGDTMEQVKRAATRIATMRVFRTEDGKMNKSILDIGGEVLLVSNFTLCTKEGSGARPDFGLSADKAEVIHILLGDDGRVDVVLDGEVLRGQAKGVPADGEEHVVALHAALAGDDVHGRVGAGMAHVQAIARGIGELDQAVELGHGVVVLGGEGLVVIPVLLPFRLDLCRVVGLEFHGWCPPCQVDGV